MKPSVIIQLRKEFEVLKQFKAKNAPNRLSYFGYICEFIAGGCLLGLSITSFMVSALLWAQLLSLLLGIIVLSHSLYLIFRFHYDKHWMKILELLLSKSKEEK
jgi:hypothetical protein